MYENISLIKEVNELLSRKESEKLANEYLQKINLSNIGDSRLSQCSTVEIFYTMFIRALMTKESDVIILSPFLIMKNLRDMKKVMENMNLLNTTKKILIFDTIINEDRYKGCPCHMIK